MVSQSTVVGELVTNDDDNDDDLLPDDIVDIMQTVDLDTDTLICFVHIWWHYIELDFVLDHFILDLTHETILDMVNGWWYLQLLWPTCKNGTNSLTSHPPMHSGIAMDTLIFRT